MRYYLPLCHAHFHRFLTPMLAGHLRIRKGRKEVTKFKQQAAYKTEEILQGGNSTGGGIQKEAL